jgi:hypothetical protein
MYKEKIFVKVTQVTDVAHGPIIFPFFQTFVKKEVKFEPVDGWTSQGPIIFPDFRHMMDGRAGVGGVSLLSVYFFDRKSKQ